MKKILLTASIAICTMFAYGQKSPSKYGKSQITTKVVGEIKISDVKLPEGNKPLELRSLRMRKLDVFPAGIVGIHSHENRPAILGIIQGKGLGVRSYKEPMEEAAFSEATLEYNSFIHYAYNLSKTDTLRIITFDLLDDGSKQNNQIYPQHMPLFEKLKADEDPFYVFAPKLFDHEISTQLHSTNIQDIKFPKGKATFLERHLRIRRVTMPAGATTGVQNYSNLPSYIIVLKGTVEVKNTGSNTSETIASLESRSLINTGKIEVKNSSGQEAIYFVTELWDPADKNIR
ncbi:hypothetical protein FKX85_05645 [Echinicola soli]|uniref:Uncharacterized protein n=1 Tax=Echinicola soli TaxID=2591634 RepID=A0A514CFD2_9BACT|nr:hypothetical protein [Echinicola soli]QDH78541.1 hypothetical protein FKX85_05645 [Echinicola soli]